MRGNVLLCWTVCPSPLLLVSRYDCCYICSDNGHILASFSSGLGYASQDILSRSPSPEIGRFVAGRASGVNIPWVAWLDLLSLSSVWLIVVMRGDQWLWLTRVSSNTQWREYAGSADSFPRVLHVSFSCFPGFSLVLDPRGRLGWKVEEFEDNEGAILG